MIELNDENFMEEIKEGKVVVDCYADWCGVCKMMKPKVEEVSNKVTDHRFFLLNVDKCPKMAEELKISNLPTVVVFHEGKEVRRGKFEVLAELEDK